MFTFVSIFLKTIPNVAAKFSNNGICIENSKRIPQQFAGCMPITKLYLSASRDNPTRQSFCNWRVLECKFELCVQFFSWKCFVTVYFWIELIYFSNTISSIINLFVFCLF